MISTQSPSLNPKTGPINTTYRSGNKPFGTCPTSCKLCSRPEEATTRIDHTYMRAVYDSVPPAGKVFTYVHFHHKLWASKYPATKGKAVFNYSADTLRLAKASLAAGVPTVIAVTEKDLARAKNQPGLKIKVCPADKKTGKNCSNCGGAKGPICSWTDRDFAVGFLVHGNQKKKAADPKTPGGCYGEAGHFTNMHWKKLSNKEQNMTDAEAHTYFIKSLGWGAIVRPHIVGDMGLM